MRIMFKKIIELIKVVSLILIAISTTYIAWHLDEIIDVLSQIAGGLSVL